MENPFGIYLYYSKLFGRKDFSTKENIGAEREYQKNFGPEAQQTPYIALMNAQLDRYAGCAIGAVAPEITGRDTLGNPIKLSDFRGKYVLLDFWASWCPPCRRENPNVVKAFNEYKDKNFTIVGISLDKDKSKWMKAIADDNLAWTHLSDLKYWDSEIPALYGVRGIPANVLLDPDGVIVAKNITGEDLHKKLKEVIK